MDAKKMIYAASCYLNISCVPLVYYLVSPPVFSGTQRTEQTTLCSELSATNAAQRLRSRYKASSCRRTRKLL